MINKAMILAAGFGTRLKPLTDYLPKALVPFGNGTMISYQIKKLKSLGIREIVVNAHHLSGLMNDYFSKNDFGVKINLLDEENILGTGGGILNSAKYLKDEEAFLVVNVDVFTNMDISFMIDKYYEIKPLSLLAVQKRKTTRYLEFNNDFVLKGRVKSDTIQENLYSFNGIHIISNKIFEFDYKIGFKDIVDIYLESQQHGFIVKGYDSGNCDFLDLGKIDNLKKAETLSN